MFYCFTVDEASGLCLNITCKEQVNERRHPIQALKILTCYMVYKNTRLNCWKLCIMDRLEVIFFKDLFWHYSNILIHKNIDWMHACMLNLFDSLQQQTDELLVVRLTGSERNVLEKNKQTNIWLINQSPNQTACQLINQATNQSMFLSNKEQKSAQTLKKAGVCGKSTVKVRALSCEGIIAPFSVHFSLSSHSSPLLPSLYSSSSSSSPSSSPPSPSSPSSCMNSTISSAVQLASPRLLTALHVYLASSSGQTSEMTRLQRPSSS